MRTSSRHIGRRFRICISVDVVRVAVLRSIITISCLHHLSGNIQFDDPLLAYFCSEKMLQGMEEQGVDSKALLALYVKVYNDIIADHPDDMTVGIHLCRGNFRVRRVLLRHTPAAVDRAGFPRAVVTSAKAGTTASLSRSSRISQPIRTTCVRCRRSFHPADLPVSRSWSMIRSGQAPSSPSAGSRRTSRSCLGLCRASYRRWRTRTSW